MHPLRRKDKAIESQEELKNILATTKYITIAMSKDNEPYLVTLSHGYDEAKHCLYFHCAHQGKKIEFLEANPIVWGQAVIDHGYAIGKCDHLFETVMFKGEVSFPAEEDEKRHALDVMINQLEPDPKTVHDAQVNDKSVKRVNIGRIDISYMSGKRAKKVIIQQ